MNLATSAAQYNASRDFAKRLTPAKKPPALAAVNGLVTAVNMAAAPPTISVQINGDTTTTIDGVTYNNAYYPVVGDTCILLRQGTDLVALGRIANTSGPWRTVGTAGNGTYGTNWATVATVGTIGGGAATVVFRNTADDMLEIVGTVHTTAASVGGTILTLPSGVFNTANTEFGFCRTLIGTTEICRILAVSNTGAVIVSPSADITMGGSVIINSRFPLHSSN